MIKTLACAAAYLALVASASALPVTADPPAGAGNGLAQVDMRCNRFGHCTLRPAAALHNPHVVRRPAGGPPLRITNSSPPPRLPIARFHYHTHS